MGPSGQRAWSPGLRLGCSARVIAWYVPKSKVPVSTPVQHSILLVPEALTSTPTVVLAISQVRC